MMAGEDAITSELLGARLLALTADVRDLQQRFAGLETRLGVIKARFSGLEAGLAVQEERMTRLIALVVRFAERVGTSADSISDAGAEAGGRQ